MKYRAYAYLNNPILTPYHIISDGIPVARTTSITDTVLKDDNAINIVGAKPAITAVYMRRFDFIFGYATRMNMAIKIVNIK